MIPLPSNIPPLACSLHTHTVDGSDANWLPFEKGEVLYTDGEIKLSGPNHERVLLAQNEAGKVGCK